MFMPETPTLWTPLRKVAALLIFAAVGVMVFRGFTKTYDILFFAGIGLLLFDSYRQRHNSSSIRIR